MQCADLDSDETNRSESGYLHRDRIRSNTYKIIATWRITVSELAKLTEALAPAEFTVKFLDLTTCSYQTCLMYAGNKSSKVVLSRSDELGDFLVDYSCNLIEY